MHDKPHLRLRVTQFGQFRLEQGVVARIIDQRQLVGVLRIEANRQDVF